MTTKKYEKKFTEMYKEADFLGSLEAEKIGEKKWIKRCDKLVIDAQKNQENIDKDINKLSEARRLFRRMEPGRTRCDMVAYYIEEDCKSYPKKCPIGVKKIITEKLKEDLRQALTPERKETIKKEIKNLENANK